MKRHACSARAYPKISAVMSIKNESRSPVLHLQATPSTAARMQWRRSCAARALGKAVVDLLVAEATDVLEKEIRFRTQLHVAILDAVVHHLRVVAAAAVAHPVTAGRSGFRFLGANALENFLHVRPSFSAAQAVRAATAQRGGGFRTKRTRLPPGMMDGPIRAPSSPPLTPVPRNRMPFPWR